MDNYKTPNCGVTVIRLADGKYFIFPGGELAGWFSGRRCVIDDFGNLVAV